MEAAAVAVAQATAVAATAVMAAVMLAQVAVKVAATGRMMGPTMKRITKPVMVWVRPTA
ncbi:hypothetical protein D3C76_1830210 [compost metagenome]